MSPYKWPDDLLSRHAYLESAGEFFRHATAPNSKDHEYSYIHYAVAFNLCIADHGRHLPARVAQQAEFFLAVERKYLKVLGQVFRSAYDEYVGQIDILSEQYNESKKFAEMPDPFPSLDYIKAHINDAKKLFEHFSDDLKNVTLSGADKRWAHHYKSLATAIKSTARIRKQMSDGIAYSAQKKRDAETLGMAQQANEIATRSERHSKINTWFAGLAAVVGILALVNIQNIRQINDELSAYFDARAKPVPPVQAENDAMQSAEDCALAQAHFPCPPERTGAGPPP